MGVIDKIARRFSAGKCAAVIVAAGTSVRMNGIDKMLASINGKPMILRTCEAFNRNGSIAEIIVVARKDNRAEIENILKAGGIDKLKIVVDGGATRTESVNQGCNWVSKNIPLIAVHDGARPLVSQSIIDSVISMAVKTKAAAPAVPVKDTIRCVEGGIGVMTPDRSKLYAMQTPQIFDTDLIRAALVHCITAKIDVTDECAAVESLGMKVNIVPGEEQNIKVTTRLDLAVVNALARKRDEE